MKPPLTVVNNRQFADTDPEFREACAKAGIKPSQRQASKWRLKMGKAWDCVHRHIDSLVSHDNKLSNK